MRTTIVIDDELMRADQEATGLKTKRAVVEAGLKRLVRSKRQLDAIHAIEGVADWQGDLRSLRKNRDIAQR
jgi:Arc/MetJ family transcription regulator